MSHLQRHLERPGVFPADHLAAALRRQQIYGGSLDTALLELELVTPPELGTLLKSASGLPLAAVEHLAAEGERPWSAIPNDLLQIGWAVPLLEDNGQLVIAVHPDLPDDRLGALYRTAPGAKVVVAPECCLETIAAERDDSIVSQRFGALRDAYVSALRSAAAVNTAALSASRNGASSPRTLPRLAVVDGPLDGDERLPDGIPRDPSANTPPHAPPVRFSARGTAISADHVRTAEFDEGRTQRALAEPRRALLSAQTSEDALAAFLRAVAVITTRVVLFRRDGTTLRALPCKISSLSVPVGACWDVENTPASTVLHARRWAGDTADPALQALLGYDDAYPCMMCSIVVAHQALMVLYTDHGGREFVPGEASILLELCRDVGSIFERLLAPVRPGPSAVAPPPAFGTTTASWTPTPLPVEESSPRAHAIDVSPDSAPHLASYSSPDSAAVPTRTDTDDSEAHADADSGWADERSAPLRMPPIRFAPGPRFSPPPLDEQENSGIIPLASPIDQPSVRGRILLDDEDWTRPTTDARASEAEQRRIDALLDGITHGESDFHRLQDFGEPALARLAALFPGPLDVLRRDLRALPPPSAHGPMIRAAISLGEDFVPHLLERFTHPDPDVRFYAAFVFQELRDPACILPLSALAFDGSADVRVISMRVLETYARYPRFGEALEVVRRELSGHDRNRQLHAARGVGTLRDIDAIETLIELLASKDRFIQEAALESLCSITGQQHGLKPHRWKTWYADHHDQHRIEWIIESLRHRDLPVRRWAHDELVRVTGHRVPFSPLGDRQSREVAARAWGDWWASTGAQHFREIRSKPD